MEGVPILNNKFSAAKIVIYFRTNFGLSVTNKFVLKTCCLKLLYIVWFILIFLCGLYL